jgi:peroxiredoxin
MNMTLHPLIPFAFWANIKKQLEHKKVTDVKKTTLILLFLICAFFLALTDTYAQDFFPWPIDKIVGEKAPDFTLKDLSGRDVTLSSFKGKAVVLNFWATWCPYCRHERQSLKSLYEKYNDKDLVIIAVSIDKSSKTVKKYMEQHPAPHIVLTDPEGTAAALYNVMGMPTTFLIDRNGRINRKFPGMVEWTDSHVTEYIDSLLEKK